MQERPNEGEIVVNGHNLASLSRREIQEYRRGIGFVFQDFKLIPTRTVLENISFVSEVIGVPPAQQRRRAFQVLKWVGLQHRMNAYPQELSGGEQQRIAIARALVNDPALLLADEPTGNLDPDLSLEIMNLLREVNAGGTTVLVATHDRELIRLVGRRTHHARSGPDRRKVGMRALDYAFRQGWASLRRGGGSTRVRGGRHRAGDERARRAAAGDLEHASALLARWTTAPSSRSTCATTPRRSSAASIEALIDQSGVARRPRVRLEGAGAGALPPRVRRARVDWPPASATTRFRRRSRCACSAAPRPTAAPTRCCAGSPRCRAWPTSATTASGWRRWAPASTRCARAGLALALLMALAAAVTVAAVVRLGLHARREEIEIMQLVGAPMPFIRGPFVAEGLLQGGIGALAAVLLLWGGFCRLERLVGAAADRGARGRCDPQFLPARFCALLVAGGMAVGGAGGFAASRQPSEGGRG